MNEDFPALPPFVVACTLERWDEPHRRWHTRGHLWQLMGEIAADPDLSESDREMLRYVALFHDSIYVPSATDNEEQSARLAALHLVHYPRRLEVIRVIMATKTHRSDDLFTKKFNGWDCAILREKSWQRLLVYEEGIAFEFQEVKPESYRRGRTGFLRQASIDFQNPLLERLASHIENERKLA